MAKRSIWYYIQNIPANYWIFCFVAMAIILATFPLQFPIQVEAQTRLYYEYIENIPKGSVVLYAFDGKGNRISVLTHTDTAPLFHLFQVPGIKLVIFSSIPDGATGWDLLMRTMDSLYPALKAKKTYGVDYVYLGYISGQEAAFTAICSNLRSTVSTDYYGTPLNDLPLMVHGNPKTGGPINDYTAYYFVNLPGTTTILHPAFIRVFGATYNIPIVANIIMMSYGMLSAYIPQYIKMYFIWETAAQYESLTKIYTPNYQIYVSLGIGSLFLAVFMILVPIAGYMERREVKRMKYVEAK